MAKKKFKFKSRRPLDLDALFRKRAWMQQLALDKIAETFPDPDERAAYIESLLNGLDNEPIKENG